MKKIMREIILMIVWALVFIAIFTGAIYIGLTVSVQSNDLAIKVANTKGVENGNYKS